MLPISGSLINLLCLLTHKHKHILLELNNVSWLICLVNQHRRCFLATYNYICLLLKIFLEILKKAVFIYNLSKGVNFALVIIKKDIEFGNISSTCITFPIFYRILVLTQISLLIIYKVFLRALLTKLVKISFSFVMHRDFCN